MSLTGQPSSSRRGEKAPMEPLTPLQEKELEIADLRRQVRDLQQERDGDRTRIEEFEAEHEAKNVALDRLSNAVKERDLETRSYKRHDVERDDLFIKYWEDIRAADRRHRLELADARKMTDNVSSSVPLNSSKKAETQGILERGKRYQNVSNEKAKSLEAAYSKGLESGQRDRDGLSESLTLCQQQLDDYMEEHAMLIEENHTLKEDNRTGLAEYLDVSDVLQTSLNDSTEEIGRLTGELDQALAIRHTLDTKLDIAQKKVHRLEESLTEVQEECDLVSQELQTSNDSLESVRAEHLAALQKLQAANQDLESLREEHGHVSQRLRTANQSLESCHCSNGQNHPRKRRRTQVQESERGVSSHSRTSHEPHNEDRQRSGIAHLDLPRQQNDVHPDDRSLTDSTAHRRSPLGGPTITRSEGGGFSMLVSELEGNDCTSDIIPDQVLAIIRRQLETWTHRDADWTKKTGLLMRCVNSRHRHRDSNWPDDDNSYACSGCRTRGQVCSLLETGGILRFLPLKTPDGTTKTPDEVEYWVELSE